MGNKAVLALILALVLLVAGGMLPGIAGDLMDASRFNKIEFATASDIQLEFSQSDIPMEEILGIMGKATHTVEVPTDLARHSAAEIKQLASQSVSHYVQAGLFPLGIDTASDFYLCVPKLWYEQTSSRKSNIFWTLVYASKDSTWELEITLDDRTGAVCALYYTCLEAVVEPIYEDRKAAVTAFAELFLADLGENAPEADLGAPTISADEDLASATLTWPDIHKGDCHIVFYVHDYAMYTIHY